jgi:hypothetical protein
VAHAFRLAFGRRPDAAEAAAVKNWSEQHRTILAQRHARGEKLVVPDQAGNVNPIEGAVLVDLCHTLLNSNEFVYRN